MGHRIAVHNQSLAVLQHNVPAPSGCTTSSTSPISLAFLRRFPSEAKAAWLSEARLAHWLKANGYFDRKPAADLIGHLRNATIGRITGAAAEASELTVLTLVDLLAGLRQQQDLLEGRIKKALLAHPDWPIFQSLPRSGVVRAATLLAEIGVAPSTPQSGKHLNVAYRSGCNKRLPAALIEWAKDTPRANAWAHDTYYRARERGCRHPRSTNPGPGLEKDPLALLAPPPALRPSPPRPSQHPPGGGCLT